MYTRNDIMELAGLSAEAKQYFTTQAAPVSDLLSQAAAQYLAKRDCEALLDEIARTASIHRYTADMLMLLTAACDLGLRYEKEGYSKEQFRWTISDLGCKYNECMCVYGIMGTCDLPWFERFYDCTRFQLGRLQFETFVLAEDRPGLGKKGETVINCHIPSSGPLPMEQVIESLDMAHKFYGFTGRTMPVICDSWMLYPPFYELFPEGSNLRKFYDLFFLAGTEEYPDLHIAWRIFGTMDEDMSKWPRKTRLQQNFYDYLAAGNKTGFGMGCLNYIPSSTNSPKVEST